MKLGRLSMLLLVFLLLFCIAFTACTQKGPEEQETTGNETSDTTDSGEETTTARPADGEETTDSGKTDDTGDETSGAECEHTLTELRNVKQATCTEDGYTGDTYCKTCDMLLESGQPIPAAHGETEIKNAKAATCTAKGYTGDTYCKVCHEKLADGQEINMIAHVYDNGKVTKNPTCSEAGVLTKTCSGCGDTLTEPINATGEHEYLYEDAGDLTHHETCAHCTTVNEYVAHVPTDDGTYHAATCEQAAYHEYVCADCNATYQIIDPGSEKLNHDWDAGTITTPATCCEEGELTQYCKREGCDGTQVSPIPVNENAHNWVEPEHSRVEATCIKEGLITYVCSNSITHIKQVPIPKCAHTLGEAEEIGDGFFSRKCTTEGCTYETKWFDATAVKEATVKVDNLTDDQDLTVALESADIALPQSVVKQIMDAGEDGTDVTFKAGTVDEGDKEELLQNATNLGEAEKERLANTTIYDFDLLVGGSELTGGGTTFAEKVTITLPYTPTEDELKDPDGIEIWYVNADGEIEHIPAKYADGCVTFEAEHFSYYAVAYEESPLMKCARGVHDWETTETVSASCSTSGYTLQECKHCHTTRVINVTARLAHTFGDLQQPTVTCTEGGWTYIECSECHAIETLTYIRAKGHTPDHPATCTEDSICTDCHEVAAYATGHDFTEWETVVKASEVQMGIQRRYCLKCGEVEEIKIPYQGGTEALDFTDLESFLNSVLDDVLASSNGKVTVVMTENGEKFNCTFTAVKDENDAYTLLLDGYFTRPDDEKLYDRHQIVVRNGITYVISIDEDEKEIAISTLGRFDADFRMIVEAMPELVSQMSGTVEPILTEIREMLTENAEMLDQLALPVTSEDAMALLDRLEGTYVFLMRKLGFQTDFTMKSTAEANVSGLFGLLGLFMDQTTDVAGNTVYSITADELIATVQGLLDTAEELLGKTPGELIYDLFGGMVAENHPEVVDVETFEAWLKEQINGETTVKELLDKIVLLLDPTGELTLDDLYAVADELIAKIGEYMGGEMPEEFSSIGEMVSAFYDFTLDELLEYFYNMFAGTDDYDESAEEIIYNKEKEFVEPKAETEPVSGGDEMEFVPTVEMIYEMLFGRTIEELAELMIGVPLSDYVEMARTFLDDLHADVRISVTVTEDGYLTDLSIYADIGFSGDLALQFLQPEVYYENCYAEYGDKILFAVLVDHQREFYLYDPDEDTMTPVTFGIMDEELQWTGGNSLIEMTVLQKVMSYMPITAEPILIGTKPEGIVPVFFLSVDFETGDEITAELPAEVDSYFKDPVVVTENPDGSLTVTGLDKAFAYEFSLYGYTDVSIAEVVDVREDLTVDGATVYELQESYWYSGGSEEFISHDGKYYEYEMREIKTEPEDSTMFLMTLDEAFANPAKLAEHWAEKGYGVKVTVGDETYFAVETPIGYLYAMDGVWYWFDINSYVMYEDNWTEYQILKVVPLQEMIDNMKIITYDGWSGDTLVKGYGALTVSVSDENGEYAVCQWNVAQVGDTFCFYDNERNRDYRIVVVLTNEVEIPENYELEYTATVEVYFGGYKDMVLEVRDADGNLVEDALVAGYTYAVPTDYVVFDQLPGVFFMAFDNEDGTVSISDTYRINPYGMDSITVPANGKHGEMTVYVVGENSYLIGNTYYDYIFGYLDLGNGLFAECATDGRYELYVFGTEETMQVSLSDLIDWKKATVSPDGTATVSADVMRRITETPNTRFNLVGSKEDAHAEIIFDLSLVSDKNWDTPIRVLEPVELLEDDRWEYFNSSSSGYRVITEENAIVIVSNVIDPENPIRLSFEGNLPAEEALKYLPEFSQATGLEIYAREEHGTNFTKFVLQNGVYYRYSTDSIDLFSNVTTTADVKDLVLKNLYLLKMYRTWEGAYADEESVADDEILNSPIFTASFNYKIPIYVQMRGNTLYVLTGVEELGELGIRFEGATLFSEYTPALLAEEYSWYVENPNLTGYLEDGTKVYRTYMSFYEVVSGEYGEDTNWLFESSVYYYFDATGTRQYLLDYDIDWLDTLCLEEEVEPEELAEWTFSGQFTEQYQNGTFEFGRFEQEYVSSEYYLHLGDDFFHVQKNGDSVHDNGFLTIEDVAFALSTGYTGCAVCIDDEWYLIEDYDMDEAGNLMLIGKAETPVDSETVSIYWNEGYTAEGYKVAFIEYRVLDCIEDTLDGRPFWHPADDATRGYVQLTEDDYVAVSQNYDGSWYYDLWDRIKSFYVYDEDMSEYCTVINEGVIRVDGSILDVFENGGYIRLYYPTGYGWNAEKYLTEGDIRAYLSMWESQQEGKETYDEVKPCKEDSVIFK